MRAEEFKNMNFNQFQKFIPKNGERIIFVEEGSPKSVLVSFEDYQEMSGTKEENQTEPGKEKAEQPKEEISTNNEVIPEEGFTMQGQEKTELTLDDLPF